jgi:FkbM family methyltransferase
MTSKLPPEELRRLNSMEFFIEEAKRYQIKPNVIFDIGAYNAAHCQELGKEFNIHPDNLHAFEAHPGMVPHAQNRVKNVHECAISNFDGKAYFNAIDLTQKCHHGCSSLYDIGRPHNSIEVKVCRIDTMMNKGLIPTVAEMVKIDVEGKSWEVLSSFGGYLHDVQILHVECETKDVYGGQKTLDDIVTFMSDGFTVVHELFIPDFQKDLIFVRNDLLVNKVEL